MASVLCRLSRGLVLRAAAAASAGGCALQNRSLPCSAQQLGDYNNMDTSASLAIKVPLSLMRPIQVPGGKEGRLLMGPGPSNCSRRVREALSLPLLGHLHPEFLQVMDEAKDGLRYLFQTNAPIVCCISGTGHAGMEAMLTNLLEEGEIVLIAETGIWGQRAADMSRRQGLDVRVVKADPGEVLSAEQIEAALQQHKPAVLFTVHGESSTGVLQPIHQLGDLCHRHDCLLLVDTVASAGGVPLLMDEWKIDAIYTGTQKVLSAPPSLAPCALNHRARDKLLSRRTPVRSYYMDILELANYWGCDDQKRRYHHTGPVTSVYALREALSILTEEGLKECWKRHSDCAAMLYEGIERIGLQLYIKNKDIRVPTVTTIDVPEGVKWDALTSYIMKKYNIEMSGGLGPTAGKVWRIGLMGENCTPYNVQLLLGVIEEALSSDSVKSKL